MNMPPPEAASPPRRIRGARWVAAVLALLASVLLIGAAALSWLLGTADGNAWLLARAPMATATQPAGRVFGGAFSAQRVEVRTGARTITLDKLAWRDAHWAWRPHDGAWFGLVIDGASIERVQIGEATVTASLAVEPTTLRLPFALAINGLRVGELQYEAASPLRDIAASIELGHDAGREHRITALAFNAERAIVSGNARIASDAPFALDAQLGASSLREATRPWKAKATAAGPLAAIAVSAQLTSPQAAGAQLDAEATVSPFAAWPLSQLRASTRALDLSALSADAPQTQIAGEARIDTQGHDKPITASVKLSNAQAGRWDERRLPLAEIELDIAGRADQRDRLTLRRFDLRAPGDGGRATGQGEWKGGTATIDLTLHALRPALLDNRAPAMALSGTFGSRWLGLPSPDGTAPSTNTLQLQSKLALEGKFDGKLGDAVRIDAGLQAQRNADGWRVELNDAQARAGAASLRGALQAERSSSGAAQLKSQGQAQGFDPAQWWGAAPRARLNGQWKAELQAPPAWRFDARSAASWLGLRGKTELDVQDSTLGGVPLQATLRADGAAAGWSVDAKASAANNKAALQGLLAARADGDRWRADIDAPALAALRPLLMALAPRAALDGLDGTASGQMQVNGRWPAVRTSGTLRGSALRAGPFSAAQLSAQWQAAPEREAPLSLKVEGQRVARGEASFDTLRATIDGTLATHRIDIDGTSALRPPAWTDTLLGANGQRASALKLRGEGRWQSESNGAGQWRAKLDELDARGGGAAQAWLAARNVELRLALDAQGRIAEAQAMPGAASVLGAALTWREARWQAATPQRAAQVALDAEFAPLAIAPWLQRLQPEAGFGGDLAVKGRAVVSNTGNAFAADVVVERASGDLTVTSDGVTQNLGMSDLRLSLAADQGTWHFAQAVAGSNLGVLVGATSMRLPASATWPAAETPMQGVLEWRVADLGVWAPFTPPGWRVGGRLRTSAVIGGRFGAPEIEGRMDGSGLAVRNLLQGVDLRDGDLALSLRGAEARVERFVFKGGDGELRLSGGAALGAEPKATLQLVADKFRLLGRADRRVVTSGNATLALDAKSLALNGQLNIDEGLIDISRADAPSLDGDVTVRGGRQAADKAAEQEEERALLAARNARTVRDLRVNVQLDLGDKLRLRGRGLDTRLTGRLAISSPNNRLALNGQVRAVDGQYAAYGQKLKIERGEIGFSGELENPRLDILAVRPNLDVEVGVQVSGTAQAPRVRLASTPEMADYDKLSWLMLGRAPDGLARNDTALLQRAALAILAGEGQGLDAQLLGRIGLDEFSLRQVESGEVRETVVALGKQLSRRWYVGYERSVNNTTGNWQLVYRAAQRFTLRAQSGTDNSLDAIWTWRWN
jgi:translocation and assembly module TamB